jgi:hypothetical protein
LAAGFPAAAGMTAATEIAGRVMHQSFDFNPPSRAVELNVQDKITNLLTEPFGPPQPAHEAFAVGGFEQHVSRIESHHEALLCWMKLIALNYKDYTPRFGEVSR